MPIFLMAKATYSPLASLNSRLSLMQSVLKVLFQTRKPKNCLNLPLCCLNPQVKAKLLSKLMFYL